MPGNDLDEDIEEDPEEDPKDEEDPEEDPNMDLVDDEDGIEAMENQVKVLVEKPMAEELPIPRGTCPMVISTWPLMIRKAVVARGRRLYTGASSSRAQLTTSEDRDRVRE